MKRIGNRESMKGKEGNCVKCGGSFKVPVMGSVVVHPTIATKKGLAHWSPFVCLEFKKKKEVIKWA